MNAIVFSAAGILLTAAILVSCAHNGSSGSENADSATTDSMLVSAVKADSPPANVLSEAEEADGWQLLFNGQDLNDWHSYQKKQAGSAWKVIQGSIVLDTLERDNGHIQDGGDLVTNEAFADFDLKLDWKIEACGNSGIIFYSQEMPQYAESWNTGPEMQVLDNACNPDAKINKHHAGDLYDLISSDPATVKPAGEWNQVEIIARKGDLQFFLNGSRVLHTHLWDADWKNRISGSKFKNIPGFGTFHQGHIALQDHGFMVWYRNIRIKNL